MQLYTNGIGFSSTTMDNGDGQQPSPAAVETGESLAFLNFANTLGSNDDNNNINIPKSKFEG